MRSFEGHPKLNKLKAGMQVKINIRHVDWVVKTCPDFYSKCGTQELHKPLVPELHFWLTCALYRIEPIGEVVCFGGEENDSNKKCVGVEVKVGRRKFMSFYYESDLEEVKDEPSIQEIKLKFKGKVQGKC